VRKETRAGFCVVGPLGLALLEPVDDLPDPGRDSVVRGGSVSGTSQLAWCTVQHTGSVTPATKFETHSEELSERGVVRL
jgi:hypothetical protein